MKVFLDINNSFNFIPLIIVDKGSYTLIGDSGKYDRIKRSNGDILLNFTSSYDKENDILNLSLDLTDVNGTLPLKYDNFLG